MKNDTDIMDPIEIYTLDICKQFMNTVTNLFENEHSETTFENCINKVISDNVKPHFIKAFNTCNCCKRHTINRPIRFEKWIDKKIPSTQYSDCNCKCRHFSRFICRTCK